MSTGKPRPRRAFAPAPDRSAEPEHPLAPARKPERSRLAEAPREPFGTRLPADLVRDVKVAAATRGLRMQEVVEQALRTWLQD